MLGDFGAAWSYASLPLHDHVFVEAVEIRAFGILALVSLVVHYSGLCVAIWLRQELMNLSEADPRLQKVISLAERCLEPVVDMRPTFAQAVVALTS